MLTWIYANKLKMRLVTSKVFCNQLSYLIKKITSPGLAFRSSVEKFGYDENANFIICLDNGIQSFLKQPHKFTWKFRK